MKRLVAYLLMISMALGITAFECSSKEMTSAKMYINQKKYDKAMEFLQKETELNPQNAEALYLLGYLHGEEGNYEEMMANFEKSSKLGSKFAKDITDYKKYSWGTSFNKGVAFWNRAGKVDADSSAVLMDMCVSSFKDAILIQPDSSVTYQNLAYAYVNMNKKDEAISNLKTFIGLKKDVEAYTLLGSLLNEKKDYTEMIKYMKEAWELYPSNGDVLALLSNGYIATEQTDVALTTFKAGVDQEPENKLYRYNYGTLLMNLNKYTEAMEQFEKALEIDPDYINAKYNLAATYVRFGQTLREEAEKNETGSLEWKTYFEKAVPMFEAYLATEPDDAAAIWEFLGKVYANLGLNDKMEEAYKKADELR